MPRKKNSKKGENKMENESIEIIEPVVEPVIEPEVEPVVEPIVEPEVEPVVEPELPEIEPETVVEKSGVVIGCTKLNMRENSNKDSKIIGTIDKGVTVQIDLNNSTDEFYKVSAYGKEGYCMKQFINIK